MILSFSDSSALKGQDCQDGLELVNGLNTQVEVYQASMSESTYYSDSFAGVTRLSGQTVQFAQHTIYCNRTAAMKLAEHSHAPKSRRHLILMTTCPFLYQAI